MAASRGDFALVLADYPSEGAFRVHRAPTKLRPRDSGGRPDRYDDPKDRYRVRYLATTLRGSLLEVLDHFRQDINADLALAEVANVEGTDVLEEEPPGLIPDRWLSDQRVTVGELVAARAFLDVTEGSVLAALNNEPLVQHALRDPLVQAAMGPDVRLDIGTICAVGPAGRTITQAVSQAVYLHPSRPAGIAYFTRFDLTERCWAAFNDRTDLKFTEPQPFDPLEASHVVPLREVARIYGLTLPPLWRGRDS